MTHFDKPVLTGTVSLLGLAGLLAVASCGYPRPPDIACARQEDCQQGQACDLATRMCISALVDGGNRCVLDDECDSHVCRPDGACAVTSDVLYVDPAGTSAGECTPTSRCEFYYATSKVTPTRSALHLNNGTYDLTSGLKIGVLVHDLILVGNRNVRVRRSTSGPVLEASDGGALTVRGISLDKQVVCSNFGHINVTRVAFANPGIEHTPWITLSMCSTASVTDSDLADSPADGIRAEFGGDLAVTGSTISRSIANGISSMGQHVIINRSTVTDSGDLGVRASVQMLAIHRSTILSNHGGGISGTGGIFDITNNFIARNGNDNTGEFGGLRLDTTLPGNRVIHNTIDRNDSNPTANPLYAGGFFCRGGGVFANNLIVNNFAGSATQPNAQTGGTCDLAGSLISAADNAYHFVSSGALPFNYHLADRTSQAVNAGMIVVAGEPEDFDGEPRNDGAPDVGADELKP
jgi:hypothetical protein